MRKIIAIGESVLDTLLVDDKPVKSFVGGCIANAAASSAMAGVHTTMVSECGTDHVGDLVVGFLQAHGVEIGSVDRFVDGTTESSLIFVNGDKVSQVNYGSYPLDRFDVVWPRIDEDDIVIFGSFYSIDSALRERLYEMVRYAAERKAIIIYVPGFHHDINCRITKVMPAILENLELSDVVIANDKDINDIFPNEIAEKAFHNHIEFYCKNYIHLANDCSLARYFTRGKDSIEVGASGVNNPLGWQSGFIAGIACGLIKYDVTRMGIEDVDGLTWNSIMEFAVGMALEASESDDNCIKKK